MHDLEGANKPTDQQNASLGINLTSTPDNVSGSYLGKIAANDENSSNNFTVDGGMSQLSESGVDIAPKTPAPVTQNVSSVDSKPLSQEIAVEKNIPPEKVYPDPNKIDFDRLGLGKKQRIIEIVLISILAVSFVANGALAYFYMGKDKIAKSRQNTIESLGADSQKQEATIKQLQDDLAAAKTASVAEVPEAVSTGATATTSTSSAKKKTTSQSSTVQEEVLLPPPAPTD